MSGDLPPPPSLDEVDWNRLTEITADTAAAQTLPTPRTVTFPVSAQAMERTPPTMTTGSYNTLTATKEASLLQTKASREQPEQLISVVDEHLSQENSLVPTYSTPTTIASTALDTTSTVTNVLTPRFPSLRIDATNNYEGSMILGNNCQENVLSTTDTLPFDNANHVNSQEDEQAVTNPSIWMRLLNGFPFWNYCSASNTLGANNETNAIVAQDLLNEPLLPVPTQEASRNPSTRTSTPLLAYIGTVILKQLDRVWRIRSSGFTIIAFLLLVVAMVVAVSSWRHQHTTCACHNLSPAAQRLEHILQCAHSLARTENSSNKEEHLIDYLDYAPEAPQRIAMQWFFEGPGRFLPLQDCRSVFDPLYTLILLRETLHVPDPSWRLAEVHTVHDICHWKRVTCNGMDEITHLSLTTLGLKGSLNDVTWKGLASSLQSLQIFNNPNITGSIPTQLAELTALQILDLQQTSLSGTLPSELGRLSQLTELLVDDTYLTGSVPTEICQLSLLHHLHVASKMSCACCD